MNKDETKRNRDGSVWSGQKEDKTDLDVDMLSSEERAKRAKILRDYQAAKAAYDKEKPEGWMESPSIRSVDAFVGEGHHSTVYSVKLSDGNMAVLKIDHRNLVEQFQEVYQKVSALRRIEHPNISRLIGFVPDWEEECSYILMEYIPGDTLWKQLYDRVRVSGGSLFPWWRVVRWADQLLTALGYLHDNGLVHGDVRLSNIMLLPKRGKRNEEHDICLIDFNWAAPDKRNTRADSPEEVKSPDDPDTTFQAIEDDKQFRRNIHRDIYYTGTVMYQLLTGEFPGQEETRRDVAKKQKSHSDKYKRDALMKHGVEEPLANVIVKALAARHNDRYDTAQEMRDALKPFLEKARENRPQEPAGDVLKQYNRARDQYYEVAGIPEKETLQIKIGRLDGIIGQGRHSYVYKGELAGAKKQIVLKADHRNLLKEFPTLWEKIQMFQNFRHKHISQLLEFVPDWDNNCSYVVMEFIPGDTLQNTLYYWKQNAEQEQNPKMFPQNRTITIALQALDALEYLHSQNVVHGDIDLCNVILRPEKQNGEDDICLIDFAWRAPDLVGGAVRHDNKAPEPTRRPEEAMGPHTAKDEEELRRGKLRDIYHVGAIMYQLLTGEVHGSEVDKKQAVQKDKELSRKSKLDKLKSHGVSDSVAEVIVTALSASPDDRYKSAEEMRNALLEASVIEPAKSSSAWKRWFVGAAVLFIVGLCAVSVGLFQTRETKLMKLAARDAERAMSAGNYTSALLNAERAVGSGNLLAPPVPADSHKIVADVLGVYQFADGYRPWYSISTADYGKPVCVRISPNGNNKLAVMFKRSGQAGGALIQTWDMETGKPQKCLETDGKFEAFVFLGGNSIIYADAGELICRELESDKINWRIASPAEGAALSCMTLSGDGSRVAAMFENDSNLYLSKTVNMTSGETVPYEKIPLDKKLSPLSKRLFALNEDGSMLAVSFSGTELAVYNITLTPAEAQAVKREDISLSDTQVDYTHFDGGFYEGYNYESGSQKKVACFFYSAYKKDEIGYISAYQRYNLDEAREADSNGPLGGYRLYEPIHARVDKSGMYRTQGNSFFKVPTEERSHGSLGTLNQPIALLEHYPSENPGDGRILLGTTGKVQVRGEDGRTILMSISLSEEDISYSMGCISERYLTLVSDRENRISVLKWMSGEARDSYSYPVDIPNSDKSLHRTLRSDKGAVVLYDDARYAVLENGMAVEDIDWKEYADYGDGGNVLEVQYERSGQSDTGTDCVKVIRENDVLYCPAQGGEEPYPVSAKGQTYSVRYMNLLTESTVKSEVANQEIVSVSVVPQLNGILLALRRSSGEAHSILLNGNHEKIADIPGICEALSDGTLFFDNGEGLIMESSIPNLSGMRQEVRTRANALDETLQNISVSSKDRGMGLA